MVMPAKAQTNENSRASYFFSGYGASIYKTGSTTFQVWFDVDSNARMMDRIGVSSIEVYWSSNKNSWTRMATYEMNDFPEMTDYNTSSHTGYVTYYGAVPGYYTAYVTFYAEDSRGTGVRDVYTAIVQM